MRNFFILKDICDNQKIDESFDTKLPFDSTLHDK